MNVRIIDLSGQKFGYWTVVDMSDRKGKSIYWNCICICGTKSVVEGCRLRRGASKSCRCKSQEFRLEKRITHGDTVGRKTTKEFRAWSAIINRCRKPNTKSFEDYGGRGIDVCDDWFNSYEKFLDDMGRSPKPYLSIDRIDNDKGYYKENCRWATLKQQAANKRSNIWVEYNGERKIISEWEIELKVPYSTLNKKLKNWQSFDRVYRYFKSVLYQQNKIKHSIK